MTSLEILPGDAILVGRDCNLSSTLSRLFFSKVSSAFNSDAFAYVWGKTIYKNVEMVNTVLCLACCSTSLQIPFDKLSSQQLRNQCFFFSF